MVKKSTQAALCMILTGCVQVVEYPSSFSDDRAGRYAAASAGNDSAIMSARRKVEDSQRLKNRWYRALSSSSVGMSASGLDGQMRPSISFDLLKYLHPEDRLEENLAKLREAEQQHQESIRELIEELAHARRAQELARARANELARRHGENQELYRKGIISQDDLEDGKHELAQAKLAHTEAMGKSALRAKQLEKYQP